MNIRNIFSQYNIEYAESGKNISKGWIGVNCPFCEEDEGFHLGINEKSGYWSCWKNSKHRGKGYYNLFRKLLKCSEQQLRLLCEDKKLLIEDEFNSIKDKLNSKDIIKENKIQLLNFFPEFLEIKNKGGTKRFWDYLIERGFDNPEIIISNYHLLCCLINEYKFRIIMPIYKNSKLVTWTSRSIYKNAKLRYLSHAKELSVLNIKDTLFDYDYINGGGEVLFITEGPFDAMKMHYLFPSFVYKVTCLYTKSITNSQEVLLYNIAAKYDKIILLLDKNELSQSLFLMNILSFIPNFKTMIFPFEDIKDPGELTSKHMNELLTILQ